MLESVSSNAETRDGEATAAEAPRKVLIVADTDSTQEAAGELRRWGWAVDLVSSPRLVQEQTQGETYRVAIVEFRRYSRGIAEEFARCAEANPQAHWLALVERSLLEDPEFRDLLYNYCYDFHSLPVEPQRLQVVLGHAYGVASLRPLTNADEEAGAQEIVGSSESIVALRQAIRKMARVNVPVMITGESGTGKELIARAIHRQSDRRNGPLVAVNCAALPGSLIQSELFGHEKGAFTGAERRAIGRIEAAHEGTIFLDEIGDLSADLQVNLLRCLETSTIERLGSPNPVPVDVRIVAATNVELEEAVREGKFREDLYYRLNVLRLHSPPLRERGSDIRQLAEFFFNKFSRDRATRVRGISSQALDLIERYPWPGNVRELINRIRQAIIMCDGRLIQPEDLALDMEPAAPGESEDGRGESGERPCGPGLTRFRI